MGAGVGEAFGGAAPDAGGCAGDDGYLAGEVECGVAHDGISLVNLAWEVFWPDERNRKDG